jgi:hypothetical protein
MPVTIDGSNTPTAGGIGYGDGSELAFTAAGTSGQVLTSAGSSAPTWSALNLATAVTGTLPPSNGGTGQTSYTNGQLLIGNTTGNTLTKATLTAGAGISITNGAGSITIATAGGPGLTGGTIFIANNFGAF